MASVTFPLSTLEQQIKTHAILMSVGFLICLPLGVLLVRYMRTFTNRWWFAHAGIQFIVSGPIIFAGFALGHKSTDQLFTGGHWVDPHKKIGLALLILYLLQLVLGLFIHFVKVSWSGRRPPQNYFHAILGLAILALAAYQVHYGITIEWPMSTGNVHPIPQSAINGWTSVVVVFWAMFGLGLFLLPRQWAQERSAQESTKTNTEG